MVDFNQILGVLGVYSQYISKIGFYVLIILVIYGHKEIGEKIKLEIWKRKGARIKFIDVNHNVHSIIIKRKDNKYFDFDGKKFILNHLKSVKENGIQTFYYPLDNAFAHDFTTKNALDKIYQEVIDIKKLEIIRKNKFSGKESKEIIDVKDLSHHFHDVYETPYATDARNFQEVVINAQLSSRELWEELIKLLKSKNLIFWVIIVAAVVGINVILGWSTLDKVTKLPICTLPPAAV